MVGILVRPEVPSGARHAEVEGGPDALALGDRDPPPDVTTVGRCQEAAHCATQERCLNRSDAATALQRDRTGSADTLHITTTWAHTGVRTIRYGELGSVSGVLASGQPRDGADRRRHGQPDSNGDDHR